MRKLFLTLSMGLFVGLSSQTVLPSGLTNLTSENYVYSRQYLDSTTTSDTFKKQVQSVTFYDGLGRPKQMVGIKASPLGNDVVTHIEYDGFGRQTKDYLPVPQQGSSNGTIYGNPFSNVTSTPYGTEKIYSEKILENSPLDRIQQQIQVGNAWSNKAVNFGYETNTSTEVKKFVTTTTWSNNATSSVLTQSGNFGANQLYKNTVVDEDGNRTIEYKNGEGQTLLVRKHDGTKDSDTYYVYSEYNQLAFVIQPEASAKAAITQPDLDELCYQYRYDGKGRLVEKKLPGKGFNASTGKWEWEYMVYDKQDRLVLTQDANLRTTTNNFGAKGWLFTKYDKFGRVVYTGFFSNGSSRVQMQTALDNMNSFNNEERVATASITLQGLPLYYTKQAFPTGSMTLLSVNYYDTYPTGTPTIPTTILTQSVLTQDAQNSNISTKGLPVASYVKNIENNSWTKNYTWYDTKGRVIGTHSINHLGGYTKTESLLDFSGVVKELYTYHKRQPANAEVIIKETFTYDHQNRLLVHKHQVNSGTEEILAQNEYNELGQLKNKKVGGTNTGSPLEIMKYDYNVRGWMTGINLNNDPAQTLDTSKLFSYKINYNNDLEGLAHPNADFATSVTKRYNGNIAEISWRSGADTQVKRYGYVYDNLNRLLAGLYQNPLNTTSKEHSEILEYDLNGNISKLKRSSVSLGTSAGLIDDLHYNYTGNRLTSIVDNPNGTSNPSGYEGGGNPITYDANGNMTDMLDKGIASIAYNYLNLPKQIEVGEGNSTTTIKYTYKADGTKLKKENVTTTTGINSSISATNITDYLDGFHYLSNRSTSTGGGGTGSLVEEGTQEELSELSVAMEREAFSAVSKANPGDSQVDNAVLQFIPTAEGFYDFVKNKYIYQYKDHLGNVRVTFSQKTSGIGADVLETNDYYPFGMNHLDANAGSSFGQAAYQNYKYNGKELQETGMYDYGARMYMPDIGRWGVVDMLNSFTLDSYGYANNNPIFFNDPTGMIGEPGDPELAPNAVGGQNNPALIEEVIIRKMPASVQKSNAYTSSIVPYQFNNSGGTEFNYVPRPIQPVPFDPYKNCGHCHDGPVMMMSGDVFGFSDLIGLGISKMKSQNKAVFLGVGLLAIIATKGKAADDVVKAESKALVPMAEETFSQALYNGVEKVGGYSIYGTKGMVGNTFNRNIFLLEASEGKSVSGLRSLMQNMEAEAGKAGASRLSIFGSSVINKGFLNPNIAERFGYGFQQAGNGVILQKTLIP